MRHALVLSVFYFTLCSISPSNAADNAACQLHKYASVDFEILNGAIVFPVTIQGFPTHATLNLEGPYNAIETPRVKELKLNSGAFVLRDHKFIVNSGKLIDKVTRPVPIMIDALKIDDVAFLVEDNIGNPPQVAVDMGVAAFINVDMELDFANRKMSLYASNDCSGSPVYWADSFVTVPMKVNSDGTHYLIMELNGKKLDTAINTRFPYSLLAGEAAKTLYGMEPPEESQTITAENFMSLTANENPVMDTSVAVLPKLQRVSARGVSTKCALDTNKYGNNVAGFSGCTDVFALRLGMNALQDMHLYFAFKKNTLYFTPADAHK